MTFRLPDIEKLLRRPTIEKPTEEFLLPPPQEIEADPGPVTAVPETPPPPPSIIDELYEEAALLQDLYDLVVETAEPVVVTLPEDERGELGETINTEEYLASLQDPTPRARRRRRHFEWGLLQGCGTSTSWPVLAASDMLDMRNQLLMLANSMGTAILVSTQSATGSPDWAGDAIDSHASVVARTFIEDSRSYRFRFADCVFTFKADLRGRLFESLLAPALNSGLRELRPKINKLLRHLRRLRHLLCHVQLLRALEFAQFRDVLAGYLKDLLLQKILASFTVVLGKLRRQLTEPLRDLFTEGADGIPPLLDRLGDRASDELASVVGATLCSLDRYYTDIAADLIRQSQQESRLRLAKLQSLGERNTVGRWIQHLDQAILLLDRAANSANLGEELALRLLGTTRDPMEPENSRLLKALDQSPAYRERGLIPFVFLGSGAPRTPPPDDLENPASGAALTPPPGGQFPPSGPAAGAQSPPAP